MNDGRNDRVNRIVKFQNGGSGSTSQDFLHLCNTLILESYNNCIKNNSNSSINAYAIIPLLPATIRAFFYETEKSIRVFQTLEDLRKGANSSSDLTTIFDLLKMDADIREEYVLLQEVRNEIIHPAFFPSGSPDNCPEYLRPLKNRGLLTSTKSSSDYIFADQIKSHALCIWAFSLIEKMASKIMDHNQHAGSLSRFFESSFAVYKQYILPSEI